MNAQEAKKLVEKAKKDHINYQRISVLDSIKNAAYIGNDMIVLDNLRIHLFEDDFKYFEDLGYEVIRPKETPDKNGKVYYEFGLIKW